MQGYIRQSFNEDAQTVIERTQFETDDSSSSSDEEVGSSIPIPLSTQIDIEDSNTANENEPKRVRLTECHDWEWSDGLWKKNADQITYYVLLNLLVYIALAYWATAADGLTGINNLYLITATLTTVGLGDVSPSDQATRLIAVVVFPYGLVIFAFVISLTAASVEYSLKEGLKNKEGDEAGLDSLFNPSSKGGETGFKSKKTGDKNNKNGVITRLWELTGISKFNPNGTAATIIIWLLKYVAVIFIGAVFFHEHDAEKKEQQANDVEMTWIDAFYYATVIATTVGYGHKITTQTFEGKLFLCFYFLFSTYIVGSIIGHFSNLYISMKEGEITNEIIDDVTWVHEVDLHRDGKVNEAEFVMFKLLQLQALDHELVMRLSTKFAEYDDGDDGVVLIGQDVPSARQVEAMQKQVKRVKKRLFHHTRDAPEDTLVMVKMWEEHKKHKRQERLLITNNNGDSSKANEGIDLEQASNKRVQGDEEFVKLQELDFTWSKRLWREAARQTGYIANSLLAVYLIISYFTVIYDSKILNQTKGWYFISATLSTVGLGDYAPLSQDKRLIAVFMIPFGLIILGFYISYARAYALSIPHKPTRVEDGSIKRIFEELNIPQDGFLTKQQFVDNARFVSMSPQKAEEFFDKLDYQKDGKMYISSNYYFFDTIAGKVCLILLKIYGTILVGAIAMKLWQDEDSDDAPTWIDVFYFATVTSTSIGYGDIVPTSDSFRVFMTFYMLISTIIVGFSLNEALDLYLRDVMAEKLLKFFMSSVTYVHKADVDNSGSLSEAEFIIFKLQQMQNVDRRMLNRLIDHFEEMDFDETRMLVIGLHIPSKAQAEEMKEEIKGTTMTLSQAWEVKKKKLMSELGFDENNKLVAPIQITEEDEAMVKKLDSEGELAKKKEEEKKKLGQSEGSIPPPSAALAKLKHKVELIKLTKILQQDNENQVGQHFVDEIDPDWCEEDEEESDVESEPEEHHHVNLQHLLKLGMHFQHVDNSDWFSHPFAAKQQPSSPTEMSSAEATIETPVDTPAETTIEVVEEGDVTSVTV